MRNHLKKKSANDRSRAETSLESDYESIVTYERVIDKRAIKSEEKHKKKTSSFKKKLFSMFKIKPKVNSHKTNAAKALPQPNSSNYVSDYERGDYYSEIDQLKSFGSPAVRTRKVVKSSSYTLEEQSTSSQSEPVNANETGHLQPTTQPAKNRTSENECLAWTTSRNPNQMVASCNTTKILNLSKHATESLDQNESHQSPSGLDAQDTNKRNVQYLVVKVPYHGWTLEESVQQMIQLKFTELLESVLAILTAFNFREQKTKSTQFPAEQPASSRQYPAQHAQLPQSTTTEQNALSQQYPTRSAQSPQYSTQPAQSPKWPEQPAQSSQYPTQPAQSPQYSTQPAHSPKCPTQPAQSPQHSTQPAQSPKCLARPAQSPKFSPQPEQSPQLYSTQPAQSPQCPAHLAQPPQRSAHSEQHSAAQPPQSPLYTTQLTHSSQYAAHPAQLPLSPTQPTQSPQYRAQPAQPPQYPTQPVKLPQYPTQHAQSPKYLNEQNARSQQRPTQPAQSPKYSTQPDRSPQYSTQPDRSPQYATQPAQLPKYPAAQPPKPPLWATKLRQSSQYVAHPEQYPEQPAQTSQSPTSPTQPSQSPQYPAQPAQPQQYPTQSAKFLQYQTRPAHPPQYSTLPMPPQYPTQPTKSPRYPAQPAQSPQYPAQRQQLPAKTQPQQPLMKSLQSPAEPSKYPALHQFSAKLPKQPTNPSNVLENCLQRPSGYQLQQQQLQLKPTPMQAESPNQPQMDLCFLAQNQQIGQRLKSKHPPRDRAVDEMETACQPPDVTEDMNTSSEDDDWHKWPAGIIFDDQILSKPEMDDSEDEGDHATHNTKKEVQELLQERSLPTVTFPFHGGMQPPNPSKTKLAKSKIVPRSHSSRQKKVKKEKAKSTTTSVKISPLNRHKNNISEVEFWDLRNTAASKSPRRKHGSRPSSYPSKSTNHRNSPDEYLKRDLSDDQRREGDSLSDRTGLKPRKYHTSRQSEGFVPRSQVQQKYSSSATSETDEDSEYVQFKNNCVRQLARSFSSMSEDNESPANVQQTSQPNSSKKIFPAARTESYFNFLHLNQMIATRKHQVPDGYATSQSSDTNYNNPTKLHHTGRKSQVANTIHGIEESESLKTAEPETMKAMPSPKTQQRWPNPKTPQHDVCWMPREWAEDRHIGAYRNEWTFENEEALERQKELELSRSPNVEKIRTNNFIRF